MKTHRGAAKRFKTTGSGKLTRKKAFASHLLAKKSAKRKRGLAQDAVVKKSDEKRIKRMLGL